MPVISALREAKANGSLELLGNIVKPRLYKKIQELARCSGVCLLSQLLGRLKWADNLGLEGGGSNEQRPRHRTPAWVMKPDPVSKTKTKQKNPVKCLCGRARGSRL